MARNTEFGREMDVLEAEIKRLEAEYNQFFAGRLPKLPWESRARVEAMVKRYDRMQLRNTAERFRFSTLQARFASFCDLWERVLRAREEGRPLPGRVKKAEPEAAKADAPAESPPPTDTPRPGHPRDRIVHVAAVRDPAEEAERVQELYERLAEARKEAGEPPVPYARFAELVRAQVTKLGGGATAVAFRVALKDGKVTLTAKPLRE